MQRVYVPRGHTTFASPTYLHPKFPSFDRKKKNNFNLALESHAHAPCKPCGEKSPVWVNATRAHALGKETRGGELPLAVGKPLSAWPWKNARSPCGRPRARAREKVLCAMYSRARPVKCALFFANIRNSLFSGLFSYDFLAMGCRGRRGIWRNVSFMARSLN